MRRTCLGRRGCKPHPYHPRAAASRTHTTRVRLQAAPIPPACGCKPHPYHPRAAASRTHTTRVRLQAAPIPPACGCKPHPYHPRAAASRTHTTRVRLQAAPTLIIFVRFVCFVVNLTKIIPYHRRSFMPTLPGIKKPNGQGFRP
jgi:hypothetical protein